MLHLSRILLSTVFILSAIPNLTIAQNAGDLDESFGDNGTVVTQLGDGNERAAGLVIQPDQKIVISGWAKIDNEYKATLVRLNPDGSYDNTFSNDGVASSLEKFASYPNPSRPLVIQPDGKLIHAGNTGIFESYNLMITRFNTDGSLDTDFDGDGSVEQSVLSGDDYANAVALQPDGKILVVGMGNTSGDFYRMAAARFNADGSVDSTFNGNGTFILDLGDHDDYINDVIILPDGKILLLGDSYFTGTEKDLVMIRLHADGSYDSSFGTDGMVIIPVTSGTDYIGSFARQSDGKIVVAGTVEDGNYFDVFVLRMEETGVLDNTFGTAGITITHVSDWDDWGETVTIAEDGKILVAGYHGSASLDNEGMVLCFTAAGILDSGFGDNGLATVDAESYHVQNIALQADHKIVISGWYSSGTGNGFEFAASRLHYSDNVGIDDILSYSPLEIFPNPSDGKFSFQFHGEEKGGELTIFDQKGRKVFQSEDLKSKTLDLKLPSGTYFVRWSSNSEALYEKLIILN